jgi:hypothetical protein
MRRRSKTKAAAVLVSGLTACNFDMGECYLRGQGTDGAGGSIIIPSAATGDAYRNGDDVGSGTSEQMAGCAPVTRCSEYFEACQVEGRPCTRITTSGHTFCRDCLDYCLRGEPYESSECLRCGYR